MPLRLTHHIPPPIFQHAIAERHGVPRATLAITDPPFTIATDVGIRRDENQDRVGAIRFRGQSANEASFFCAVVSDGMGGMQAGADCAELTISNFFADLISTSIMPPADRLVHAAAAANSAVHAKYRGKGGATLSAVLVAGSGKAWVTNVGDSRVYATGLPKSELTKVTTDDTLADAFGGVGRELVQFVGIGQALAPRVDELRQWADMILIMSDGAHFVPPHLLEDIVHHAADPKRSVDRVMAIARWLGGPDNASMISFRLSEIVEVLRHSQGSSAPLTTVWSAHSETVIAQLTSDPVPAPAAAAPTTREKHRAKDEIEVRPVSGRRARRIRLKKEREKEPQLEIKIESDGDGNASDS